MPAMSEEAKAKRREYVREYNRRWRAANPEKVAETTRRYWERKAQEDETEGKK